MKKLFIVLGMLLVVTSATFAQEKPTVVIVPFDSVGIDKEELNVLFEVFTSEFAGLGIARVVDRNSFDKIRAQHSFQDSDWSDSDKIAQLGKALNANMVVTGQLLLFKGKLIATFRMLDVNTVEIVATTTEQASDTNELFDKLKNIAKNLSINMNSNSDSSSMTQSEIEIKLTNDVAKDKNTSNNQKYNIGDDGPGGGIVFYYSENGFDVLQLDYSRVKCHYLEVAKIFVTEEITWCPCDDEFCDTGTTLNFELGDGKRATYDIANSKYHKTKPTIYNCAAKACLEFYTPQTKKGEWFLPTQEELFLLNKNLDLEAIFGSIELWSCTVVGTYEFSGSEYPYVFFSQEQGYLDVCTKYDVNYCVAIRAF